MKTIMCVLAVLCLINISIVSGQIISSKNCSQVGLIPMQNFKKSPQMGLWHMQEFHPWTDNAADCYTVDYVSTGRNTALVTELYEVLSLKINGRFAGSATYDEHGLGLYSYKSVDDHNLLGHVTILSSDYYNYSVECYCSDVGNHSESNWFVLTRSRTVSSAIQQKIDKVLSDNKVDTKTMRKMKQDVQTCVIGLSKGLGGLLQAVLSLLLG